MSFRSRVRFLLGHIEFSIVSKVSCGFSSLVPSQASSPLFVVNHFGSLQPLLAAHFNRFLKSCVAAVGLNPSNFSSRSFRQGGATFAFNCGAPTEFIKTQGDWRSDAYLVYLKLSTEKKLDILHLASYILTS